MESSLPIELKEILQFYAEAGVDYPLSATAPCHFDQSLMVESEPPFIAHPQHASQNLSQLPIPNEQQISSAEEICAKVNSLVDLKQALEAFNGCPLKKTAKNTCFSDGTPGSALMIIGEAPGREEDNQGLPFVGRSGQLLNRMLQAIGFSRQQVYIANTIPWRPPGNRTPTPLEIEICRPFIERQIELAKPKVLLAVGGPAAHSLTGNKQGILRLRGQWFTHKTPNGVELPVLPTLHPAYLLRVPAQKKLVWHDLLEVKQKLQSLS